MLSLLLFSLLAPPSLTCDQPVKDLGSVQRGDRVVHTFHLRNAGTATVHLKEVIPSCSCTTAPLTRKDLAPGERLELQATFDSRTFQGPVQKSLVVTSDDPEQPVLQLELKAVVRPRILGLPEVLRLPGRRASGEAPARLELRRSDGTPLKVLGAALKGVPALEVEVVPEPPAVALLLHPRQAAAPGPFQGALVLQIEDAVEPRLEIPVQGSLVADLSVYPESLDLGRLAPGASSSMPLRLSQAQASEAPTLDIQPAVLTGRFEPRRDFDGKLIGHSLHLQVRTGIPSGTYEGRLRLTHGSAGVEVPFRVVVP